MNEPLLIPAELVERVLREEVAARLPAREDLRRLRLELMLTVATISSDEGGRCLGIPSRRFRDLCVKHGVPEMPFGHRTIRYRIIDVSVKLDALAVAAKKDVEAARAAMHGEIVRLAGTVEQFGKAA